MILYAVLRFLVIALGFLILFPFWLVVQIVRVIVHVFGGRRT